MRVLPYERTHLPALLDLVNLHPAAVVPGWAPTEAFLAEHLEPSPTPARTRGRIRARARATRSPARLRPEISFLLRSATVSARRRSTRRQRRPTNPGRRGETARFAGTRHPRIPP
ncbi:MAG: hypothetical protein AVDCRST_MAG02-3253 [uncultured Rubrobacteraceae bacterium]|uniref:Uncharacterized protein n=1 Tax=uncultured Rubrobacteraceae bacterium TaxID=349277 RepID=A0A6J4RGY3_9ACTN|nr:MAG: hypothetical protein AVDCRST_MAG02-3253 [uncultured Rubrobacteraceae bacterium]